MNKFILLVAGLITMTSPSHSMNVPRPSVSFTVTVNGIDISRGGNIIVYVFGEKGFPKDHEQALAQRTLPAISPSLTVTLETSIQQIAIKVLHDQDENGKVTKNWTGIWPAEGLGFSNKQKVGFTGPPRFKKSKITPSTVTEPIIISLRYPK